ncbi:DUF4347 domain-containing protein [Argonema antarcticum]|uniref:DUF4347 domain-containing protein n=1 Tax=Argonema antarcticum TaxID=2942763 RepID=UPI00308461D6
MNATFAANNPKIKTLVFIDDRVDDYQFLASGVKEGVLVSILDRDRDGVEQISAKIQKFTDGGSLIDAVHIVSHGSPGTVELGNTFLSFDTLERYKNDLQQWHKSLKKTSWVFLLWLPCCCRKRICFSARLKPINSSKYCCIG